MLSIDKLSFNALNDRVERGEVPRLRGRDLLTWVGAERRGSDVVRRIRLELWRRSLATEPDFDEVWIDEPLSVVRRVPPVSVPLLVLRDAEEAALGDAVPPEDLGAQETPAAPIDESAESELVPLDLEATPSLGKDRKARTVGRLPAANERPLTVQEDATVSEATTLMRLHDVAALVVLGHGDKRRGAFTWQSLGEVALARGNVLPVHVRECFTSLDEIRHDADIFDAIEKIKRTGFVLVQRNGAMTGLVTFRHIEEWFSEQAGEFILLADIEQSLRMLARTFEMHEIRSVLDESKTGTLKDHSDLTFGGILRLFQDPARWARLGLGLDRKTALKVLDEARKLRNRVVHLKVDGIEPVEREGLHRLARILEEEVSRKLRVPAGSTST